MPEQMADPVLSASLRTARLFLRALAHNGEMTLAREQAAEALAEFNRANGYTLPESHPFADVILFTKRGLPERLRTGRDLAASLSKLADPHRVEFHGETKDGRGDWRFRFVSATMVECEKVAVREFVAGEAIRDGEVDHETLELIRGLPKRSNRS